MATKLSRDFIDFDLARKIEKVMMEHLNGGKNENPTAAGLATLMFCIVSQIVHTPPAADEPVFQIALMSQVGGLMAELWNNGWSIEERPKGEMLQ